MGCYQALANGGRMDIEGNRLWQQAAGDTNRDYVELCTKFDVILNGPGQHGAWPGCREALRDRAKIGGKKLADLERFCQKMKSGDLVVLRLGTSEVHAVGEIIGDYLHHPEFGDVDGWDLEHVRRVRWLWKANGRPKRFKAYSLKLGDTTQLLDDGDVKNWLKVLPVSVDAKNRPLAALPAITAQSISEKELAEFLSNHGMASKSTEQIQEGLRSLETLARWYQDQDEDPTEHEAIAHLALPLLQLLGWTASQLAIEWQNMDIALFEKPPRRDPNLTVVLEAKRKDRSVLSAFNQARDYAKLRPSCKRLILSDGIRYWVYVRRGESWVPHAHLHLRRLRSHYPIYDCAGAKESLLAMEPGWNPETE